MLHINIKNLAFYMESTPKSELVGELFQSISEFRYKLRKMFQVKLKESGIEISFEVLEVIKILLKQDGLSQQVLADMIFKDKSSVTYLIDNMVKSGLVTRTEDKNDRRNKLICLTDKAHELQQTISPLAKQCYLALASETTAVQLTTCIDIISHMNGAI
jgi:DNA-binding MarR family transcriptional regulator